ncbi:MAG: hypothetical protein JW863_07460 [Chitinispirillaceae bacterium]|nr:hypothetical protein [Chitinispirillaceae bacterium]
MMWRNRNISPPTERWRPAVPPYGYGLLVWVFIVTGAWAGSSTRTLFPLTGDGVADSNMVATAGGIGLAVEREATIKLLGDSFPAFPSPSVYSDVNTAALDSFSFFCVDPSLRRVVAQGVRLQPDGIAVMGTAGKFCDINPVPSNSYLHVDKGANGWCASYVQSTSGAKRYLRLSTGSTYLNVDSAVTQGWLFPSQCTFAGDTFLVVNSDDMDTVWLRKVYARGTTIQVATKTVVSTGTDNHMNCSVAVDENGILLVAWIVGGPVTSKFLHYRFFNADLTPGPADSLAQPVSETSTFYNYDDVSLVSYGPGRFALVSWDQNGVLLNQLQLVGNAVQKTTTRVISGTGFKFCATATNTRHLLVATWGDLDGNGTSAIEGIIYKLTNFNLGEPDTISFSASSVPILVQSDSTFSSALNAAVDDSGTFALTWRNGEKVGGSIWSHRSIRFRQGFYTSPVDSLTTGGDSIWFEPAAVTLSSTSSWYTVDSLRTGATAASCNTAPWVSFSDANVLDASRTTDRYYQYRIALVRTTGGIIDSLTTPNLSAVTVPWNLQPAIDGIDSVKTGGTTRTSVAFGDTVTLLSRNDSARISLRAHDRDNGETVTIALSQPSTPADRVLTGGPDFSTDLTVLPIDVSDTVVHCSLTIHDDDSWEGVSHVMYLKSRNSVPELRVRMLLHNGSENDTIDCTGDTAIMVEAEDTVEVFYAVFDSNDAGAVRGYIEFDDGSSRVRLDSATMMEPSVFTMRADTAAPSDTMRFYAIATDPDTTVFLRFGIMVNHPPRIRMVVSGDDTLDNGDTLNVVLDDTTAIVITVDDTDLAFGDTVFCRTDLVGIPDSVRSDNALCTLHIVPDDDDTVVRIVVADRNNRTESLTVYLAFPWYATDSVMNPGYAVEKQRCAEGISLIAGSSVGAAVTVPLLNTGRNRLYLNGLTVAGKHPSWLTLIISGPDTSFTPDISEESFEMPLALETGDTARLLLQFDASGCIGDTVECVRVVLFTDDPRHRTDTFTVCLEYNDLPRIVSVNPYFIADRPYRRTAKKAAYVFPPHAAVAIVFSEPMDSATAVEGLTLYSALDRRATTRITPIPLEYEWLQGHTTLHLIPHYADPSPAFGVLPPEGLFIPTDSLMLILSSNMLDRATTPSGPNALDVDQDNRRDTGEDTAFGMRVDRIDFTVADITPLPGDSAVARQPEIILTFSSPIYAASVDTSHRGNRSLQVTSMYAAGDTLAFRSVTVDGTRVVFTGASELFYRDSLSCNYSSRWILDRMGFATDNNGDGIDATLFDSISHEDDLQWGYRIKTLSVSSVTPDSGSVTNEVSPLVTIHFDDRLPPGVFDTDTSKGNRSFRIGSERTGWSSFTRIRIAEDSMSVSLLPRITFFSNDSVFCRFNGFSSAFRYSRSSNLPDTTGPVFSAYSWSFESGEIGFYTYPNPYKPGVNPRHCSDRGPCGIWFKNLHTLGNNLSEVAIAVFSQTAHPVFDSRKSGRRIRFGTGAGEELPQWLWNTRNNRGEPVATGLYLYAVYDSGGKVLQRGKLIIVR